MMETIVPTLKAIHDLFSPIFMSGYRNEHELFDKVIVPMRRESAVLYDEYMSMFETLRTHPTPTTLDDAEQLIRILTSFQKGNYSERRDFFEFSDAMHKRLRERVRNSDFLDHAELFFHCLLQILLGQANHQKAMGTRYTALIAYVNHLRLQMVPGAQKMNWTETADDQQRIGEEYEAGLAGYCDWNINQLKTWKTEADKSFFGCKAALVRL